MSTKTAYRPDVDGLRAVAVLGVMIFHFGGSWLPGGFTGVDVFFVISGYVITLKLSREIAAGEFSILGFYDGRVRRILPAALATILASLVAGYFLLWPGDYEGLGSSAAYSAAGLANLFFFWNTGYFDQEAGLQPLLHFWSLGVEEQFYVVWPVLLWGTLWATRSRPKLLLPLLAAATALAFVYAERRVDYDPKAAFYLPQFRAWELSIGALLVFVPSIQNRTLAFLAAASGAAFVAFSFFAIHESDPFPGLSAAYACVGAALLIWPKAGTPVATLLSLRPMTFIGKISYSLYLWHWPVWVFYRHYNNGVPASGTEAFILGAIVFGLAVLSWRYVEQPFRRPLWPRVRVVAAGVLAVGVVALAGNTVVSNAGFGARISPSLTAVSSLEIMWDWDCPRAVVIAELGETCNFGAPWETAANKILLWGDSHAEHYAPLVDVVAREVGASVVLFRACSPILDNIGYVPTAFEYPDYDRSCGAFYREAVAALLKHREITTVLLASSWTAVANTIAGPSRQVRSRSEGVALIESGLERVIQSIDAPGRRVAILGTIPRWLSDPVSCELSKSSSLVRRQCEPDELSISHAVFEQMHGDEYKAVSRAAKATGAKIVLPGEALCVEDCIIRINGEFLYRDINHIRRNLSWDTKRDLADLIGLNQVILP